MASFAVSPGHVDTAMQGKIRTTDETFEKLYEEDKLLPPEKPAAVQPQSIADNLVIAC